MKGLRIDAHEYPRRFGSVFGSVIDELDRYHWLIDTQAGPFNITDKPNFRELDAETDRYYVPVPELEATSTSLWRPGILRFADLLVIDECTYLVGIAGSQQEAVTVALSISTARWISPEFFEQLGKSSDCAFLHMYGWWEVYSTNSQLMGQIAHILGASETESEVLLRHLYPR